MVQWRAEHPDTTVADQATDAVLDRIVDAYHVAREVFADRAVQLGGIGQPAGIGS
jgi:S-adenosylmethionine synthetase